MTSDRLREGRYPSSPRFARNCCRTLPLGSKACARIKPLGRKAERILDPQDQDDVAGPGPRFFALSESADLAKQVCAEARLCLSPIEEQRFEGMEFKFRPLDSVRGRTVVVLQSLAGSHDLPVGERLMRLLFLLLGLRDAGASRRVVLLPYLTFARQDRRTNRETRLRPAMSPSCWKPPVRTNSLRSTFTIQQPWITPSESPSIICPRCR